MKILGIFVKIKPQPMTTSNSKRKPYKIALPIYFINIVIVYSGIIGLGLIDDSFDVSTIIPLIRSECAM